MQGSTPRPAGGGEEASTGIDSTVGAAQDDGPGAGPAAAGPGFGPVGPTAGSDSDSDSDSMDLDMEQIQRALRRAQVESEEALRVEQQRTRVGNRAFALRAARQEAADEAQVEAAAEARAKVRAESAAAAAQGNEDRADVLMGSLLGDAALGQNPGDAAQEGDSDDDGDGTEGAEPPPRRKVDRLSRIQAVQVHEQAQKSKAQWKKAVTNPLKIASALGTSHAEKEATAAAVSKPLWNKASKVKAMTNVTSAVKEISADLFNQIKCTVRIQAHCRCFLARRRLGMGPGDSLQNESTRQLAQTLLAERRMAGMLSRLSPEAQIGVSKMGTQLANMAKDNAYNNAAEHLILCIKSADMSMLVANFALADGSGLRPIHNAAKYKNLGLTKFLLNRAAELNLRDKAGLTPLHHACAPPFPSALLILKSRGIVDADALTTDCTRTAGALLAKYALKSVPDNRGYTPLHLSVHECVRHINFSHINSTDAEAAAFAQCCLKMMQFLVDMGCSVGSTDKHGNSMLGTCCHLGGPGGVDVAGWLLDRGADLSHVNREGKTPFFLAMQHGHGNVASLLRDHGADQNAIDGHGITPKEHARFLRRISNLLYCDNWPKDFMDSLKEEKLWTGTEASKGVHRVKRDLTRAEQQHLQNLEELINSKTWEWGPRPPATFTEFHNPSHRDFESPFEILDPLALGSLLYYDSVWVQMDDEGAGMVTQLDVDCALFFVPLARATWRCTWPGRMLGTDEQAEWVLKGGMRPFRSFKAHDRGITSLVTLATSITGGRELLATISEGLDAKIWDVHAMQCAATLRGHRERITCVTHAANIVFTGSTDRTIRKWVLNEDCACRAVLRGHTGSITSLAVDKAAVWLVSGAHDGAICVWHIPSSTCTTVFGGGKGVIYGETAVFPRCLILEESRSYLYCGLHNGEVQLWDLHKHMVPVKRPTVVNRTKPRLLLPGKPDEIVATAREMVNISRSKLNPLSSSIFDAWDGVSLSTQDVMLPGCTYEYSLKVKNFGPPLKSVVVKDMLETGMEYLECRPVAAAVRITHTFNGRPVLHWHLAALGVAKEATLTVRVKAQSQGKFARPVQLVKPAGLAVMRMKMINGDLHCGFQGGNVLRLKLKYDGSCVPMRTMFKQLPLDDDPWTNKQVRKRGFCHLTVRLCVATCRRMCRPCASKEVAPIGKPPIAQVIDTHTLNQMTDQVGDLEQSILVTGLDGDSTWTSFCVGKEVHAIRGKDVHTTNYHPISVRAMDVSTGSMAIGYSDGVVRVWPMTLSRSWEDVDLFFVFIFNVGYFLLLLTYLPCLWRSSSVVYQLVVSYGCRSCKRPLVGTTRRRLILDGFICTVLDLWSALIFLLFVFLLPPRNDVKAAWKVKLTEFKPKPHIFSEEMVDAYWVRLSAHFARLDSIASRLSARLSTGSRRLQTFCREALYGGHRSHIVSIDAWGARVFTACKSGIICEWHLKDIDTIQVQWNGRAGTTCMRFMPVHDRLTTMWVGSDDGYLDVRNLLNSGEVICSFAGGQRGGATCMAMGRINEHSSMYIGWQDGSILKTQLTKPIGALLMREVEILAVLDGHVKSVVDVVVHNYIVYSRSQGRVLAHSMKSHECLVCFNDSDEDVVSDFCCWNEFMFVAHNHNVLVWNLSESLHRKDPMGLNDLNVEGAEGKMIAAKGGKLACVLEGHTALVTSLKLSKNSIFSGSGDGTIREWKLSHPWECVVVFDSQVDRVDRMAILHDQLYCSHPDGLVRGWKLGDAPTALTKGKEAKNLKKTTTETLDKLLRQAKASQRDLRDVTFGPHTGRCAEVLLDPPTAVTAIHAFESPPLDGRVYIGLQSGEIRVVEGVTGGQLAQMRCGHNSGGVGWLALEIFSTFTQLVQLVGLGFCIDNLLWSYSGASVRQSLGPLVFRARGFHAPAFKPVFLRAAILCALYVALVVCQVEYNLVGNLVLRCKYSVRMYMQHLLTFISATSWYLVWLGSTVLVIPATRGLATVFDCKRNCWQGEHAVYAGISAALLLLYVPLAARLSCVHGDVLRLAHGRWATWRLDAYRDDAVGFVPTFCVRAERTWVFPFATFMKVAAALLSTVTQIPSLCAFWLCLISLIMVAVALFAAPFRSRNGNLIVLGGFLVFGASSTAAFASSWFQDWQYDRPAVVFLATCFPILIGPAALLNLSTIGHAARYTCSAMVRALSCLSLAAYSRRRRKKELQAKVKMAIGGSSVLLKLLGTSQETQAAAAPKMTLLQRMQAAQATVEGSSTDVSTTTAPGRPSLASAAPGRLRNGAPPLPSGSHTHSMDGGAPAGGGDKRMRWKKVSLATKLGGISGRDDATVAKALHTRRSCWGKVKYCATRDAWRACLVTCWKYRNPQEIADAVKRLGRKLKVRARWVKDSVLHPDKLRACCKAKAAAMKTPISKCWQRCTLCAKEPGRLVHSCCRFAKGYCVFIGSTIAAWFVQLRCSRWVVRKLPQRALCPNCRSCCRRVFRSLCRGHVDRVVGIDDSLGAHGGDRFLVFWEECEAQEREEAKEREEAVARRDKQAQYEAQMKLAREENLRRREEESGARDAAFDPTLPDARADDGSQVVTQEPEPETASTPPEMLTPRSGDIAPDPEPVRDKEPRRRAFKW